MANIYFQLNPALPFINVEATKGFFFLQYPSGWSYWEIQDEKGTQLKNGNYTFSAEVLSQWTDSDQVLINDILAAAPWIIKDEPVIEEQIAVEEAPASDMA